MKKPILVIAILGAAFVVWQWWLGRRNPALYEAERRRVQADAAGRAQENLQLGARPRLIDPEAHRGLGAILLGPPLGSQILPDGTVRNGPHKRQLPDPWNFFLFGFPQHERN